jgi:uncharacterized RDD family membrane protein YckC
MEEAQQVVKLEYAGFWVRLGAYAIDAVALAVINTIPSPLLELAGLLPPANTPENLAPTITPGGIALAIVGIAYFIGFWTWRGQTPGKMALRIRILRTDGSPISLGQAFLRYLGYIISAIILLIGYLMIAFDRRKQGLHDKIADTFVVKLSNC